MAINPKTHNQAVSFLKAIEISDKILSKSNKWDAKIIAATQAFNAYSKDHIENGIANNKLKAYEVKSLGSDFFIFWNDTINMDVELFWEKIKINKLPYQRKSPIQRLLQKGRFKSIEQWMDLFNNFDDLQKFGFLKNQFTIKEVQKIKELMEAEEKKRFELVNKCLQKKKIPSSQYMKFGESMAFLERCNLTSKYFTKKEKDDIYRMWKGTR